MTNNINHKFALAMTRLQHTDKEAHTAITRKMEDARGYTWSWRQRAIKAEEELRAAREEMVRGDTTCH